MPKTQIHAKICQNQTRLHYLWPWIALGLNPNLFWLVLANVYALSLLSHHLQYVGFPFWETVSMLSHSGSKSGLKQSHLLTIMQYQFSHQCTPSHSAWSESPYAYRKRRRTTPRRCRPKYTPPRNRHRREVRDGEKISAIARTVPEISRLKRNSSALRISKTGSGRGHVTSSYGLSLIHIWRCRRSYACRSRWSPYH